MSNIRAVAGVIVAFATVVGSTGLAGQEDIRLVTVVGCLQQETGEFPWVLQNATEGTEADTPYTSRQEVNRSSLLALGSLAYRLVGVDVFGIDPHVGHRVQVKGLKMMHEGQLRLNVTSFQRVTPRRRTVRGRGGRPMVDECGSVTP